MNAIPSDGTKVDQDFKAIPIHMEVLMIKCIENCD